MKLGELQIRQGNLSIRPDQIQNRPENKPLPQGATPASKGSFNDILNQKINEQPPLKFSAHAMKRMDQRGLHPSVNELERLNDGVEKAREKGADSSLILVDDMAYVVSVKNQTVITALDKDAAQGNVFSNIDSVAIV